MKNLYEIARKFCGSLFGNLQRGFSSDFYSYLDQGPISEIETRESFTEHEYRKHRSAHIGDLSSRPKNP